MEPGSPTSSNLTFAVLWLSNNGNLIYTGCGNVFSASTDQTKDMRYVGSFASSGAFQSLAISDSLGRIAGIPSANSSPTPNPNADDVVDLFDSSSFNAVGQFATTAFQVNSQPFTAHGRWVFYNSTSSTMFIITQADSSAGLEQDFAIETVSLSNPNSCAATFAQSTATAIAPGSYANAQILSGTACVFNAVSNASWISLSSGYSGSGNTTLTYLVRPNVSSTPRSGTISIGPQTLAVTQAGAGPSSVLNPLSFKPVAFDYDNVHYKIVMVAAYPNELHIYDPVSQADQTVPLDSVPLSVSVRPDGLFAAVGFVGKLCIIDLQALTAIQVVPLEVDVRDVILAGNGYAYAFPGLTVSTADIYSVQLSTGTPTLATSIFPEAHPRLDAPGSAIYTISSRWNIAGGAAALAEDSIALALGISNIWVSQDGSRLIGSGGNVYFSSSVTRQDFAADGSLSATTSVASAAESQAQQQIAVLTADTSSAQLQIYPDAGLQLQSQEALPMFTNNGQSYNSVGKYLTWNSSSTKLFAVTEAASGSGLLSDYAISTISPASVPSCSYSLSPTSVYIQSVGYGDSWMINVTSNCSWIANIPSNTWLHGDSSYGVTVVGNGQIPINATDNYGPARSLTIQIANQSATITQAASTCTYQISSFGQIFNQAGGTGTVALTTASSCPWSVQRNQAWLTVVGNQFGTGSAYIQFSVAPNSTANNTLNGTLNIAGNAFSVSEITNYPITTSNGLNFVPVTPCRIADTRDPAGSFGGPYIAGQSIRTLTIPQSACNIPYAAQAYSLNVTVVSHDILGYLTVWPSGQAQPVVSTLNSYDGRVKANAAIIQAGTNGEVNFFATDDTDLVVDTNGYFVPAYTNTGLAYYPVTPCRVSDTRSAPGPLGGPTLAANQEDDVPVLDSNCDVPATAQAYSMNFTAVPQPNTPLGYLSVWPSGQNRPLVSTLNAPTSAVTANAVIVPAGTNGAVSVFVSNPSDVVIDVDGYFAPVTGAGLQFYGVSPCRVYDTRSLGSDQPLQGTLYVAIAGSCGIPGSASAIVLNATVVPSGPLGFLALWPYGLTQPLASNLNSGDGTVVSNMAIVPMLSGGINAYTSSSSHLVLDVTGYFAP